MILQVQVWSCSEFSMGCTNRIDVVQSHVANCRYALESLAARFCPPLRSAGALCGLRARTFEAFLKTHSSVDLVYVNRKEQFTVCWYYYMVLFYRNIVKKMQFFREVPMKPAT